MSPYGDVGERKAADIPPVSELESPKLKIAGNLQSLEANAGFKNVVTMDKSTKQEGNEMGNLGILRDSIGRLF